MKIKDKRKKIKVGNHLKPFVFALLSFVFALLSFVFALLSFIFYHNPPQTPHHATYP